ncbi:hypothetical protein KIN20_010370 [Parelaphostrongylus tenuis]|uniref:Uncharacterized protein n=1 Tax=Parelaphostrongylus tenuis TaxID=148309 RepID=A0AAD5QLT3_PARTN|nr:hypothetical protein KIN20_010370 [Parelaphostrongylus tenuis]
MVAIQRHNVQLNVIYFATLSTQQPCDLFRCRQQWQKPSRSSIQMDLLLAVESPCSPHFATSPSINSP